MIVKTDHAVRCAITVANWSIHVHSLYELKLNSPALNGKYLHNSLLAPGIGHMAGVLHRHFISVVFSLQNESFHYVINWTLFAFFCLECLESFSQLKGPLIRTLIGEYWVNLDKNITSELTEISM